MATVTAYDCVGVRTVGTGLNVRGVVGLASVCGAVVPPLPVEAPPLDPFELLFPLVPLEPPATFVACVVVEVALFTPGVPRNGLRSAPR
jgi:hypothetical protein